MHLTQPPVARWNRNAAGVSMALRLDPRAAAEVLSLALRRKSTRAAILRELVVSALKNARDEKSEKR